MADPVASPSRFRLSRALLPVLLHDIGNTTQRLVGVRALLDLDESALLGDAGTDLAWASERAHEQGWLMGFVAAVLGVEISPDRRWSESLAASLALVAAALARDGFACKLQRSELPRWSGADNAPNDFRLCAALGAIVHSAGTSGSGIPLELQFEPRGAHAAVVGSHGAFPAREAFVEVADLLGPRSSFEPVGESWGLLLPASWLDWRKA
jgi:hypothetical protein